MLYIPYAKYLKNHTANIIILTKFEEGILLSESCNSTGNSDKSYDDLTIPQLISEDKMDEISLSDKSDTKPMSTDMLENTCDGNQYHLGINRREARYKIHGCIKQRRAERKGALLSTQNMGKGSHKVINHIVNELSE